MGNNMKTDYALKIKLGKIAAFVLIDSAILIFWNFISRSGYASAGALGLSAVILGILLLIPVWKLKLWTVFTECVRKGRITHIEMKYVLKNRHPGERVYGAYPDGTDSMGNRYYAYEYYLLFTVGKGKVYDVRLEYTGDAHIFPYKEGDEIIMFPYAPYPQIEAKDRTVCVFCGMPVKNNDFGHVNCHYCARPIIKQ